MSLASNKSSDVIPSRPGALFLCIFFKAVITSSWVMSVSRTWGVDTGLHAPSQQYEFSGDIVTLPSLVPLCKGSGPSNLLNAATHSSSVMELMFWGFRPLNLFQNPAGSSLACLHKSSDCSRLYWAFLVFTSDLYCFGYCFDFGSFVCKAFCRVFRMVLHSSSYQLLTGKLVVVLSFFIPNAVVALFTMTCCKHLARWLVLMSTFMTASSDSFIAAR